MIEPRSRRGRHTRRCVDLLGALSLRAGRAAPEQDAQRAYGPGHHHRHCRGDLRRSDRQSGASRVEQQLNNLGDNFVWIEAGGRAVNGVRTGTHDTETLVYADAIAVRNQVSLIKAVSPNVDDPVQVIYGNQNWHTSYRGVSPEFFEIKRWYLYQGAIFSQDDVDRAADVCVLGRTVRDHSSAPKSRSAK